MILAADIGGTNTRLRLLRPDAAPTDPIADRRYRSREHDSLERIIHRFFEDVGLDETTRPTVAGIGIAGPVFDGHSEPTNLRWTVNARRLAQEFEFERIEVMNDLVTTGYGVRWLNAGQLHVLNDGEPYELGNGALIAAGTGLGVGILIRDGDGFRPIPSEGGHCDFAPRDAMQDELVRYLRGRFGSASAELVVSGPGLHNIYEFLAQRAGSPDEQPAVAERMRREDPGKVISSAARDGSCELCRAAMDLFLRAYGAEASNLAAVALATGGVFIGGGIAPKLIDLIAAGPFLEAFFDNPKLAPVLAKVPVKVILEEDTSLIGAAGVALSAP